ncbi:MAG: endopeptidase La [Gemmatimonadota bacterium]|nr:endopeptidase La [Gemmatimonadota bacterium]MDQ8167351.1 endopeptidase La [Gemmatimonadota bacterium]MDQ8171873.1 endopeptidase La [Gemmatimonadota bacterium]
MPVLPLRDVVLFPHVAMPLLIGREGSLAAVAAASDGSKELLLVTQRDADQHAPGSKDLHRVGVLARLQQVTRLAGGTTKILVEAVSRVRVQRYTASRTSALLEAQVLPMPLRIDGVTAAARDTAHATLRHALSLFEEYAGLQRRLPPEVVGLLQGLDDEQRMAFGIAAHLQIPIEQRQRLLESPALGDLAGHLVTLLGSELELLKLEKKLDEQVRGSLFQNQREFYLQEQLRAIHKELGQEDGDEFEELARQVAERGLPAPVAARAQRELRKLKRSSPMSPDATVTRGWLDWALSLPWTVRSDDTIDLDHARSVLEADHYGLEEVKERILDYIAVLGRVGHLPGPILCLVGPPGVGKTSLGKSIAHALGRKFVRMALGGVRDEAEIRGHRRTYIGALPGRIIQAMRRAETINPVILLDEIDKLGSDWRGDPAAALLEVLDPEQHHAFNDHFLEVDYDLSQVLFLTTANSLGSIPEALRDRMEIIRLPGYLEPEKITIARRFLLPRQLTAHGITPAQVTLEPNVLQSLIRGWTREAGVRDLDRRIARLARKLARRALAPDAAVTITKDELPSMLGPAAHDEQENDRRDQIGVASGLAFTHVGGELLEIEVSVVPGRGRLQLTGTLGDVIKESAAAALSYVRSRAGSLGLAADFHRAVDIHIHLPAGATPKDGPSAGIALATALTSALTGIPVRGDVAMTGEVTLRGRVLPIGGVREKGVAAHRHHMAHVIVPQGNAKDLAELPEDVRNEVHWHPVRTMDEVLALALRGPLPDVSDALIMASETERPT